ncbi:hypothetical protein Cgig2_016945 [Carnegiea gigantea]|uniref:Uncharacterized protein n=1 Tax=Carnegiea gigantea TaxID=171969 RepID=A0A9Q1JQG2_9CARY|nr:hypothetical protein Cgig2_016945 [Carnegiea gigantea]
MAYPGSPTPLGKTMILPVSKVDESKGIGSKLKSKSKSDTSPIPIAGGNELAQLVNMMEKMQTTLDESEKKMMLMATILQNLIRDASTKAPKTFKGNYQNRDKKNNGSTSQDKRTLDRYAKYTPIDATYTQTLECLLFGGFVKVGAPTLKRALRKQHQPPSRQKLADAKSRDLGHQLPGSSAASPGFLTSTIATAKVSRRQVSEPSAARLGFLTSSTVTAKVGRRQVSGPQQPGFIIRHCHIESQQTQSLRTLSGHT